MKVLLLSYSCEPGQGSEAGIGWHWAEGLARDHDVTVLTHPRGRAAIQKALASNPDLALRCTFVELPAWLDPWKTHPGERHIHFRYILWQFRMYLTARKVVRQQQIDVVHHVSWITMTGPTLGWALRKPFIWGPVGSGQQAPLQMRRHLGNRGWVREALRNIQVRLVRVNPLSILAARSSVAAIASNLDTYDALGRIGARHVELIHDSAVDADWLPTTFPERPERTKPVIAWLGRVESRKAPRLALEAFAKARATRPCELWIIGQGSQLEASLQLARQLGIQDDVKFLGRVPHDEVPRLMRDADIFLFTSLRDTFPTVVLEAMALGLPVVSINHQGLKTLPDAAVMKVPVTNADQIVDDLAGALEHLVASRALRTTMGHAAWKAVGNHHLWNHRLTAMQQIYATALHTSSRREEQLVHGHSAD